MAKHEVRSPIPGTFYRKPAPDQPVFKEIGDTVAKGDTIGLVEVMKTFHEIKADADGTITGFPIDDAEPVMAGQTIAELG
ncbi:acetyl-CoA carboxylase [Oricola nitratireducens]|jgi:biotin carboxyl carrier protein|uniref:acetyl-CoA carboxylase n=1 Tax=Oricola nitratireducens TaxID=2775868 RepID=UPI001865B140|nr:acetyl-CoA carboxylase [Oricola nitratireducens]